MTDVVIKELAVRKAEIEKLHIHLSNNFRFFTDLHFLEFLY